MKNNDDSENGNGSSKKRIQIINQSDLQSRNHKNYFNLLFDLSEEADIIVNTNNSKQFLSSYRNYQVKNIIGSSINHKNCIKSYSFRPQNSETSIIEFCLDNNVFLVAVKPIFYPLFERINKLRSEAKLPHFLILIKPKQFNNNKDEYINKIAIIGGTFHALHNGHTEYIDLAFKFADKVHLLVTSDEFARVCKQYKVKSFNDRKEQLQDFLIERNYFDRCNILSMNSEHEVVNFCLNNDISLSVVIPEYYPLFEKINRLRECQGLVNILILIKQRTLTKNGFDINSTIEDRFSTDEKASGLKATWEN